MPEVSASRRGVLATIVGATAAALLSVPLLGALLAPLRRRPPRQWFELGRVDDLTPLEPRAFRVRLPVQAADEPALDREVFVVRRLDGTFLALLGECTHLGCPVRWLPERRLFYCPCHRGFFNVVGHDVNGPPPQPLRRLRHRVDRGVLSVMNEQLREDA